MYWDSTYRKYPEEVSPQRQKEVGGCLGLGVRMVGVGEDCSRERGFLWSAEKILELDSSGCTTLWVYSMSLSCILRNS